jgi:hypothetical protein
MKKNIVIIAFVLIFINIIDAQINFKGYLTIVDNKYYLIEKDSINQLLLTKGITNNEINNSMNYTLVSSTDCFSAVEDNENALCFVIQNNPEFRKKKKAIGFIKIPYEKNIETIEDSSIRDSKLREVYSKSKQLYKYSTNISNPISLLLADADRPNSIIYIDILAVTSNHLRYILYYPTISQLEIGDIKGKVLNVIDGFKPVNELEQNRAYLPLTEIKEHSNIVLTSSFKAFSMKGNTYLIESNGNIYSLDKEKGLILVKRSSTVDFLNSIWVENRKENYVGYIHKDDFNKSLTIENILRKVNKITID